MGERRRSWGPLSPLVRAPGLGSWDEQDGVSQPANRTGPPPAQTRPTPAQQPPARPAQPANRPAQQPAQTPRTTQPQPPSAAAPATAAPAVPLAQPPPVTTSPLSPSLRAELERSLSSELGDSPFAGAPGTYGTLESAFIGRYPADDRRSRSGTPDEPDTPGHWWQQSAHAVPASQTARGARGSRGDARGSVDPGHQDQRGSIAAAARPVLLHVQLFSGSKRPG